MGNSTETVSASWFETIIASLQGRMTRPHMFSGFHLLFLGLLIAACLLVVWRRKKLTDKTIDLVMWISATVMILFEIYKQLVFSYQADGTWHYEWYIFPFQFCSTPMYTFPLVFLMKDCKFRRAVMSYIATFSLFAGFIVMVLPTSVFTSLVFINIQTMVHHGLQVVFGVYMAAYNRKQLNKRFFAWSLIVFGAFASVAWVMNVVAYHKLVVPGITGDFNMFYISPYMNNDLPVLSAIYPKVPYPVYLIIYLFGFTLAAAIVYAVEKGIVALTLRKNKRAKDNTSNQA